MDLKELESGVDPHTHWYYQSKKNPLLSFVRQVHSVTQAKLTIVDVGSGSGFFMYDLYEALPELVSKIYLVDIGYSTEEIQATAGQVIEKRTSLPEGIENAIFVLMDVLEHVENDRAMLQQLAASATGRNYFFITVPAFMSLWSGHDKFLGHFRRYTRQSLGAVLRQVGFRIDHSYYFYGLIFPAVWLVRRVKHGPAEPQSDMRPLNAWLNRLLKGLCAVEFPLRRANAIAGVSCVAEGTFNFTQTRANAPR